MDDEAPEIVDNVPLRSKENGKKSGQFIHLGTESAELNDAVFWNMLDTLGEASADLMDLADWCESNYKQNRDRVPEDKDEGTAEDHLSSDGDETSFPEAPPPPSKEPGSDDNYAAKDDPLIAVPKLIGNQDLITTGDYLSHTLNSVACTVSKLAECLNTKMGFLNDEILR